ncbi:MAG: fumarylacetoacetate hydrolase family protein [Firmicutes bacterium]|nr:fumarylacetoacetate hydrolase family protein [Bacillota bacterium]
MKFVRFEINGSARQGILEGDQVHEIRGDMFGEFTPGTQTYPLSGVKLLAPCVPGKIVCVGLNYRDHAAEVNLPVPEEPVLFIKPSTTLIGPGDDILYPELSQEVDYEAELAVVIAKTARNIPLDQALDYVLGYTCANDVTARDLQRKDGQWTRAKSFDTFLPLGPYINTEVDPLNLKIELFLNGQMKQASNTGQMVFNVRELVSRMSQVMTLLPGDVLLTGTPHGIGQMQRGDRVEVKIEGLGTLHNQVK